MLWIVFFSYIPPTQHVPLSRMPHDYGALKERKKIGRTKHREKKSEWWWRWNISNIIDPMVHLNTNLKPASFCTRCKICVRVYSGMYVYVCASFTFSIIIPLIVRHYSGTTSYIYLQYTTDSRINNSFIIIIAYLARSVFTFCEQQDTTSTHTKKYSRKTNAVGY